MPAFLPMHVTAMSLPSAANVELCGGCHLSETALRRPRSRPLRRRDLAVIDTLLVGPLVAQAFLGSRRSGKNRRLVVAGGGNRRSRHCASQEEERRNYVQHRINL